MLASNPIVVMILFLLMAVSIVLCFQSTVFAVVMVLAEHRQRRTRQQRTRVEPVIHEYDTASAPEGTFCAICLETVEGDSVQLKCDHFFHELCIQQWQQQNCPLCRASTEEPTCLPNLEIVQ